MKYLLSIIISTLLLSAFRRYDDLQFTNRAKNSIVYCTDYSSKGIYKFTSLKKNASIVEKQELIVFENHLNIFVDSLKNQGYKVGINLNPIKKPDYLMEITNYKFDYINPIKDSVFSFYLKITFNKPRKNQIIISSEKYYTLTPNSKLITSLAMNDIFSNAFKYKGTNINRINLNLELITKKPLLFVTDSTVLDYNYSTSIYY